MAAYSDIIATLGGATSNSYITGANADQFFELHPSNAVWLGKTESERTIALLSAATWLDTIDFAGTRCAPSTDSSALPQRRAWPRSGVSCDGVEATCAAIPRQIIDAQCLVALNLLVNPELITGTPGGGGTTQAGTFVSKNQLGDLVQEFSAYPGGESSTNDCVDCSTPEIIAKLPWLKDLLSCLADVSTSNSKILLRVRS